MIGGRNGWIAWPAGIVCAGVVAGLVWLAAPGVPGAVGFVGDLLRSASQPRQDAASTPRPIESIGTALTDDCRSLYPDGLWSQLTWQPHIVLNQTQNPPDTSAVSVRDALSADVLMTCGWREPGGGTVTTTLARVDAEATVLAGPGFGSQGFACSSFGDGVRCTKTVGDTVEDEIVRGGMWLSTIERAWHPAGYRDALAERLWP